MNARPAATATEGRPTHTVGRPSPFGRRAAALGAVLGAALAAWGCGGSGQPLSFDASDGPPRPSERRLSDALDALGSEGDLPPDSFLVARLSESGLTPLFGGGFEGATFQLGAGGHVAAFIPGRHPARRSELVVAAATDGPAAAALLEAARLLTARSTFVPVPERTVLVAFLASPRMGPDGLADVLAAPVWADSAVARVLVVAPPEGWAATTAVVGGRPLTLRLVPPPMEPTASEGGAVAAARALTLATYSALVAAASDADPPPDSVAAPGGLRP